jgi:hypothetical protein
MTEHKFIPRQVRDLLAEDLTEEGMQQWWAARHREERWHDDRAETVLAEARHLVRQLQKGQGEA